MGPTWGPPASFRPQMGPMLASMNLAIRVYTRVVTGIHLVHQGVVPSYPSKAYLKLKSHEIVSSQILSRIYLIVLTMGAMANLFSLFWGLQLVLQGYPIPQQPPWALILWKRGSISLASTHILRQTLKKNDNSESLVQGNGISIANALEIRQSCTKHSI